MDGRQVLFVLGMGRSGSSALTRVLSLCGGSLPEPLLGANPGNPTGHWEPLDALRMDDDFLVRHGSGWHDPTLRFHGDIKFDHRERENFVEQIEEFFRNCTTGPLTIIKEPRIVALAGCWFEAARRMGLAIKIAVPVRHPNDVTASLVARDLISPELSSALWLKYNLLTERWSRPYPRVFIEYQNLLNDWRREVARASEALVIDLSPDAAAIEAFLDPALCHSRDTGSATEPFDQSWMGDVYATLTTAARDGGLDVSLMDDAFAEYRSAEEAFRSATEEFGRRLHHRPQGGDDSGRARFPDASRYDAPSNQ
jgi:hypothetical protein